MLAQTLTITLLVATLAVFVAVGLRGRNAGGSVDEFVLARNSQGTAGLGLSFLASGLGAWILFAPPEIGALLGLEAVVGYAVAAAGPFVLLAVVGPRLRRAMPSGHGLTEFLRLRFGAAAGTTVALLMLLYMGVFVAAELVAVGGLVALLGGVPNWITVLAVVAATLAYTAHGGLPASLRTDRWQGWLVLGLIAVAGVAAFGDVDQPVASMRDLGLLGADRAGIESAITLIIAVTAANMFHQGYWQRVWSARDDDSLRRGALLGAAITVPVVLVTGLFGMLAAGAGVVEVPALSVFALAGSLPTPVVAAVLVLGIALVASSVDTLENGLVALVVAERPGLELRHARWATVAIMVPATIVGLTADSVLQLFLIADLLCAALVVPALLGLWRRASTTGIVLGAVGGVLGALVAGLLATGSAAGTLDAVTFPDAVPTLPPFVGALAGGLLGTLLGSRRDGAALDLADVEEASRARATAST